MAGRFDFTFDETDGVGVLRWVGDFDALTPGWSRFELSVGQQARCVTEFCVIGQYGVLVPAVIGQWWQSTGGLDRLVMPHWDGLWDCRERGVDHVEVTWEYEIEETTADWSQRELGFVPARSSLPKPVGSSRWPESDRAALVPVTTWKDVVDRVPTGDQFNSTSLFAVRKGGRARSALIERLSGVDRPTLGALLDDEISSFVVVTQDDDTPVPMDSVIVASRSLTRACAIRMTETLDLSLGRYLRETADATSDDEWNDAVARLAGIRPSLGRQS